MQNIKKSLNWNNSLTITKTYKLTNFKTARRDKYEYIVYGIKSTIIIQSIDITKTEEISEIEHYDVISFKLGRIYSIDQIKQKYGQNYYYINLIGKIINVEYFVLCL